MADPLAGFLGDSTGSALVLVDPALSCTAEAATVVTLPADDLAPGDWERAVVVVVDRIGLRAAPVPADLRSPTVAVWLATGGSVPALAPRPDWPPLRSIRSRRTGDDGSFTVVRFTRPVDVAEVVAELGRQVVWPALLSGPAPAVSPGRAPGRAPAEVEGTHAPVEALDERLLNPIGFVLAPTEPAVTLAGSRDGLVLHLGDEERRVDLGRGATEELVALLRPVEGVRVSLAEDTGPGAARVLAGLAMAGTPLTAEDLPPVVAALLGEPVAAAVRAPVDLADTLAREEHSVVLRRAALGRFSSATRQPAVSVVLATKRPEMLGFALRQVARQRGVERLELVLAPHGFAADPAQVRDLVGAGIAVQVVAQPEAAMFGDVLSAGVAAAGGDVVLKMDDDDWYGPDAIADLLLARAYSGAQMVGMPAEFHYLAPRRLTVKRGHPAEFYARFVAGGTMLVDRPLLRSVGSFRSVRKFVDAQLLSAVAAAGGAIYRTHGLGYMLRRNATGHTWEVEIEELLDPARVAHTWDGFHPSRLLAHDPADRP